MTLKPKCTKAHNKMLEQGFNNILAPNKPNLFTT